MKTFSLAVFFATLASAIDMPSGYFRGALQGWEGSVAMGVLSARNAEGDVYSCTFDAKSYMELEKRHVKVDQLREGDPLEVLASRRAGESKCYVLSLQVVPPPRATRPNRRIDVTPSKQPTRITSARRTNQTFAGVVTRITDSSLTLRTRTEERSFVLRSDTRYFGNGLKMELADVAVNQRLSVEATRDLEGQLEAYQLTWGELTVH